MALDNHPREGTSYALLSSHGDDFWKRVANCDSEEKAVELYEVIRDTDGYRAPYWAVEKVVRTRKILTLDN